MSHQIVSTGIDGLDKILYGGFLQGQSYLIRGGPGCGKTTLGWHFLCQGVKEGESCLLITLGESEEQLKRNGKTLGFETKNIHILDLSPSSDFFTEVQTYDIFSAAEVERDPLTKKIIEVVNEIQPQRIFVDAITQFRYLTADSFQFYKQILSFLRFLTERNCTVIFSTEASPEAPDHDLQFMADGVIHLDWCDEERTISVSKFRSSDFRTGQHSMRLTHQGMQIFPRLLPGESKQEFVKETIPSGIPELDELLQGGLERSTITILTGPSGVGKSTLGIQFMKEAAGRGERSLVCCFEESIDTLIHRCEGINMPIRKMMDRGVLCLLSIEPLFYTPDQFANLVREEVEKNGTKLVMIDSIAGYKLAFRQQNLVRELHSLCRYLKNMGVAVLVINEVEMITGDFRVTELGISYLADSIIFMRYLEIKGELRKAIGVLKKRLTDFEKNLREIEITRYGIKVGRPLSNLRGILTGTPDFINQDNKFN
jgi:circadian clock protein KaiC